MPLRALARVNVGAVERNCAALARAAAPAALCAVVKADGYGHGAVAGRARGAGGRGDVARRGDGRRGRRAARRRSRGAAARARRAVARGARRSRSPRGPTWSPGGEEFVAALAAHAQPTGGTGVHVKLDTGMGRLGTRDPDGGDARGGRRRRRARPARSPGR